MIFSLLCKSQGTNKSLTNKGIQGVAMASSLPQSNARSIGEKKLKLILTSLNEENGVNPLTAWCLPKGHTYLDKPPAESCRSVLK